jgi:drug/metabolite transporter (DMT)-like permease
MLFGVSQTGLAFFLVTVGSRLIPATDSALISTLETPLAPVWVWLAFGEVPTGAAIIGGILVLGAVVGHIVAEDRGGDR